MCTPSKLPTLTTLGPRLAGTSSSLRKTCIVGATLKFELELEPVIGKTHILRQLGVGRLVRKIVRHVSEERALRLQLFDDLQRILERRVRGMRMVPQRIENQNIEPLQLRHRVIRDRAEIRCIGCRTEAVGLDGIVTMIYNQLNELRAKHSDRPVDLTNLDLRQPAVFVVAIKDVAKDMPQHA